MIYSLEKTTKPGWISAFKGAAKSVPLVSIMLVFPCLVTAKALGGEKETGSRKQRNELIERGEFIQIPGPNPILVPGPKGTWNDRIMETADAFKHVGVYYLYYHGAGTNNGYRVGLATATNPLGPFREYGDKPVLDVGPPGSWDNVHVACAMVMEGEDKFYMWYSGRSDNPKYKRWCVGLATAPHPQGPWTKYEGNPIWMDPETYGGYVGGVVKVEDKYHLYQEYPITDHGYKGDYGPMALFTADAPQGPWIPYPGNPILAKGEMGEWDDGGISEAEVLYHSGIFHMFYGGTKLHGPRLESIGYAYSFDGSHWNKYSMNPIATREANPNAASFSEVHAIIEAPFIYLYHTLRYREYKGRKYPSTRFEDLGVQVLAMQTPFSLNMPVINLDKLAPGKKTALNDSPPLCLGHIERVAITAECTYQSNAKRPIRLHVVSSADGLSYDTSDLYTFEIGLQPGQTARKTFELDTKVRFMKITVENQDQSQSVSNVAIAASLSG